MGRLFCFGLLLIAAVSEPLLSAPVPEKKNAKPAALSAGTELLIRDIKETIPLNARYAILRNEKAQKMAIMRKYITNWNVLQEKEWDAFDKWLKKNLRIERVKGKKLVRISFTDGNAEEQAAIINAVVDDYMNKFVEDRRDSMKKGIQMLRDLKERNRRDPQKTKEDLEKTDKEIKKGEDEILNLPKLVERAKAR